jgi:tRNA dimethylallyltransferase
MKEIIVVCGPTASGKTHFAHMLARKYNGEIVNADSMQLYKQFPIITASPDEKLKEDLPYHLYNFQDIDKEISSAKYVDMASSVIKKISLKGRLPIIVGGSGMYISMLTKGYSLIPEITEEVRIEARSLHEAMGSQLFFQALQQIDPQVTKILNTFDTQRVIRAYEVISQTGKSILEFQKLENFKPLSEFKFKIVLLLPERSFLYDTCNQRLKKIFNSGAIEEVEKAYNNFGNLHTTAMKSLGVAEIIMYIKGKLSLEGSINIASTKTRQYAKRQMTWFKNQIMPDQIIKFSSIEQYNRIIMGTL